MDELTVRSFYLNSTNFSLHALTKSSDSGLSSFTKVTNLKPPLRMETNMKTNYNIKCKLYSITKEMQQRILSISKEMHITDSRALPLHRIHNIGVLNLYHVTPNYVNIEIIRSVKIKTNIFPPSKVKSSYKAEKSTILLFSSFNCSGIS